MQERKEGEDPAGEKTFSEIFRRAERDGRAYLALGAKGLSSRGSGSRLNAMMTEPGCVASLPRTLPTALLVSEWKIERREFSEGEWLFLGPGFEGRSLSGLLSAIRSEEDAKQALGHLETLARVLRGFKAGQRQIPAFTAAGLLFDAEGKVLFLPSALVRGCVDRAGTPRGAFERMDADPGRSPSQFIAAALREILIRADGAGPEDLADGLPLERIAPRLHPALLAAYESCSRRGKSFPLERWADALEEASPAFLRPADAALAELEKARKDKDLERAGKRERAKASLKKARPLFIAAAALALASAVVVPTALKVRAESRRFLDYPPEKLVRTYYQAYSALDDQTIDLCLSKGAPKDDSRSAIALSITFKMRYSTEGRDPFIRAEAWLKAGRPAIKRFDYLFGLTDLKLQETPAEKGKAAFRADYRLWDTEPRADGDSRYYAVPVVDELVLKKTSLGWKIDSISRRQGDPETVPVSYAP